jgi:hypothetical protein
MAAKAEESKTENQHKVFEFFVECFKSQKTFTKKEVEAVTNWQGKSFSTYWSKQFKQFVVPAGRNVFRVSEAFRPFARWETFQQHVTQVRRVSSDYTLLVHDSVLVFEFFMPLTNETHLRNALDALFYKDTILARLRAIDLKKLQDQFPAEKENGEAAEAYLDRLCEWIAKRFQGYSITTVSGRFRALDLMKMIEAATIEENGNRYLIDETTAIVRFIFPCGQPRRISPAPAQDFDLPEPAKDDHTGVAEANQIRWFFNALFVQSIIQVVNGEAEIWMVESGMRNRLHIWRVEADSNV